MKKESNYNYSKVHAKGERDEAIPLCGTRKYQYNYSVYIEKITCTKCALIIKSRMRLNEISKNFIKH